MASGPPGGPPVYPPDPSRVQPGGYPQPGGYGPPAGYPPPAGGYPAPGGPPGYPPQPGYPTQGYQYQPPGNGAPVQPGPPGPGGQPTQAVREGYVNRPVIVYPQAQNVGREGDVYQVRNSEERALEEAEERRDPFAPSFMDKKIRQNFVAKVFAIVGLQLLFTTAFIATCFFVRDIRRFFIRNRAWVILPALFLYLGFSCAILCGQNLRRRFPWNYVLLVGLTLSVSFFGAVMTSVFSVKPVMIAFGSTALVLFVITIVSLFKLIDITKCSGIISVLLLIFLIYMLAAILVSFFVSPQVVRIMDLITAGIATIFVSLFLMYDIQTVMGGKRVEISPEEYVLGATQIYIDTFTLFILTLCLAGGLGGDS